MNIIKQFNIGSCVFFKGLDNFNPKDNDVLCIVDDYMFDNGSINMRLKIKKDDIFIFKNIGKKDFIEETIKSDIPLKAGKFLVPDFIKYLDLTIDDLKKLDGLFKNLDEKHRYEYIIYKSYLKNNDFTLTEKQLKRAFDSYLKTR